MIASVHIADVGGGRAVRTVFRTPLDASTIKGLRHANFAVAAPLGQKTPRPQLGRAGLVALWDDDAALDRFLAEHPIADLLSSGFHARLEPLRAHGTWPGLPEDLPAGRTTDHHGPAIVLTLGRLRMSRAVPFFRASAKAEKSLLQAKGVVWATALAKPPFVATCSLWESTASLSTYAYGRSDPGHPDAIAAQQAKDFHHQSAFVRFRPTVIQGSLAGRNPLPEHALSIE